MSAKQNPEKAAPESTEASADEESHVETLNLTDTVTGDVRATLARIAQSRVDSISCDEADMRESLVVAMDAKEVGAQNSLFINLRSASVELQDSAAILLTGEQISLENSQAAVVYAGSAELGDGQAGLIVARDVQAGNLRTGVLLAGNVSGPVETYLDTPRAMLAGLTAGVATGIVLLVGSLLSRRRR